MVEGLDLGRLGHRPPHALQGPGELPRPQEAVDGRGGGRPVVSLDATFFSPVPKPTQVDRLDTEASRSGGRLCGGGLTSSLLLPCPITGCSNPPRTPGAPADETRVELSERTPPLWRSLSPSPPSALERGGRMRGPDRSWIGRRRSRRRRRGAATGTRSSGARRLRRGGRGERLRGGV